MCSAQAADQAGFSAIPAGMSVRGAQGVELVERIRIAAVANAPLPRRVAP